MAGPDLDGGGFTSIKGEPTIGGLFGLPAGNDNDITRHGFDFSSEGGTGRRHTAPPSAGPRRPSLPKALRVGAPRRGRPRLPRGGVRAGAALLGLSFALWLLFVAVAAALYPEVWAPVPHAAWAAVWPW